MLALAILSELILLFGFFYGAVKLWKKGKPLYFQIIIAAIGCYALYQLLAIVMTFCDINELYFNDGIFGLAGCYLLLFCANRGSLDRLFDKPKTKYIVLSALAGIVFLILCFVVATLYFGSFEHTYIIFIVAHLPACFVVYFNVKHLFTPEDPLGMIKGLRLTDICSLSFCVICLLDIAAWTNVEVISGVADVILSLAALALAFSAIKGAEKWNY